MEGHDPTGEEGEVAAGSKEERDAVQDVVVAIQAITVEQVRLNDLFRRRLESDKVKAAAFDELYRQLEWARKGLAHEAIRPIARRLLKLIDMLPENSADDLLQAVRTELLSLLEEHGLAEVAVGDRVDPAVHEIVGTAPGDAEPGFIVEVRRPGYSLGDHLLRPAQVVVVAAEQDVR